MAIVTTGKKQGIYSGRVAIRKTGSFNVTTLDGVVQGINYRYCRTLHRDDGYSYYQQPKIAITKRSSERRVA